MKKIKITQKQAEILKSLPTGGKMKITQEQFDRVFAPILQEGGLNMVDKTFKKAFAEKDIQNLDEDNFNISAPNSSVPRLNKNVMKRGPIEEGSGDGQLLQAVKELLYHIYNDPNNIGTEQFWAANHLGTHDVLGFLTTTGLLIKGPMGYSVARASKGNVFRKPMEAITAITNALKILIRKKGAQKQNVDTSKLIGGPDASYPRPSKEMEPQPEVDEASNYPAGTENDPNAPWNMKDGGNPPSKAPRLYKVVAMDAEIAILKDATDTLHVIDYSEVDPAAFGDLETIDADSITDYVNDNARTMSKGQGIQDFEKGVDLVKIDDDLRIELLSLYDKNPSINSVLSQISETTMCGSSATGGSSGPFSGPMNAPIIKRKIPIVAEGPVAGMTADGGSSGPYDANALPNIGRDGTFKKPKKSRAEISTQYPHGTFVEIGDCTKLNNNKEAQNGGCNSGDPKVAKQRKGKGSIISKDSLLNEIFNEVTPINELGMGDWKVKAIVDYMSSTNATGLDQMCQIVTQRPMIKLKDPKGAILHGLSEMGKSDIDYIYAKLIGV